MFYAYTFHFNFSNTLQLENVALSVPLYFTHYMFQTYITLVQALFICWGTKIHTMIMKYGTEVKGLPDEKIMTKLYFSEMG